MLANLEAIRPIWVRAGSLQREKCHTSKGERDRAAMGHRDQQLGMQAARISGRRDCRNSELFAEKHTGESGDM